MTTLERNKEIAETIMQQIGKRAFYMVGAKHFRVRDAGVSFRVMRNPKKVDTIFVDLTAADDYKITTIRKRRRALGWFSETIDECDGIKICVYVENLHSTLEDMTGLSFRMPRILTAPS